MKIKKKPNFNLKELLYDSKKRKIITLLFILPFLIVIIIEGVLLFKEAKNVIGLASDSGTAANNPNYVIGVEETNNYYILRGTATKIQVEYFTELKKMIEDGTDDEEALAACIVKNYVADFYTLSNKLGQYDVGGMYYVYEPQRETIYIKARDEFYKYINEYINEYGASNLLEVESVSATATEKPFVFEIEEVNEDTGESWMGEYTPFEVKADWTYVDKKSKFDISKFKTSTYFLVVNHEGRFEIVYAGDKPYVNE